MISLRLTRVGKKKRPVYRLVAIPKHRDPWANNLEILGTINPRTKERTLKADRIKYWIGVGAQPSKTVHNLLVTEGIIEGKKVPVTHLSGKRRGKLEEKTKAEAEKKAAAEEAAKAAEAAPAEPEASTEAPAEEPPTEETPAEAEAPAEETPEAPETETNEEKVD